MHEQATIDHIGFPVSDLARSRAFYQCALAPLGIAVQLEVTHEQTGGYQGVAFGVPGHPLFWTGSSEALRAEPPASSDGATQGLRFVGRADASLDYWEGE